VDEAIVHVRPAAIRAWPPPGAKDPLALLVGLLAPEDVDLDGLEIEEADEEVERFVTRP